MPPDPGDQPKDGTSAAHWLAGMAGNSRVGRDAAIMMRFYRVITRHLELRALTIALCAIAPGPMNIARADETGASFWLSGSYASYAAVPATPGWSVETTFYHATADAGRGASFSRGGRIEAGPRHGVELFPGHAELCPRPAGPGRAARARPDVPGRQLQLDRVGNAGRPVRRQPQGAEQQFDDGDWRSLSARRR